MAYLWTTLHVTEMDASVSFYTEVVGLDLRRRFKLGEKMELCFLGNSDTEIELICAEGEPGLANVDGISLGFSCLDVEAHRINLIQKGIVVSEIISPNPMLKFFYAFDPNGLKVQFVQDLR